MRTSLAQGRATTVPTEWDVIYQRGLSPHGIIFCHGSGNTATTTFSTPETDTLMGQLGVLGVTLAGDFALQAWGNNAAIARIDEAISYLQTQGVTLPVFIVAGSMGFANAAAYTLAHPSRVKGLAGIIPLTDIADVRLRGAAASVDAAYPPAYNDSTDGPTHSPVQFAASLPANLPIHLWGSSDDTIVPPATIAAFVAARPQTGFTNLGALGHTNTAISAATPAVIEYVTGVLST